MLRKGNAHSLLVGLKVGAARMEIFIEIPQKIKNRTTAWPSNSTSGYLSEGKQNTNLKRYMHPYVHCSIVYNNQDMEAT